jgi:hypothetical protein
MLEDEVVRVSSDWIVVVVITGLLVMMTAYLVLLAFRSRRDEKADGRADGSPYGSAKPGPETGRKAA